MDNYIYLDHAATTYLKSEVYEEMKPYLVDNYGNASSIYQIGRYSKIAIENSRKKVALAVNCQAEEIIFTSGGTESDNLAIQGIAYANKSLGNHIITTSIEHPAIIKTCEHLGNNGFEITYLPVDQYGVVSLDQLASSIKNNTILISIMFANNEVGTIQPVKEIGEIARANGVYFHTDAVQAVGSLNIDVNQYDIDLLSLSAHKFYGPKGIGALYIRSGTKVDPILLGGSQERGKRPGTENVAGIVGLAKAIELATTNIQIKKSKIETVRNRFIQKVLDAIPQSCLNGHPFNRLPGNANITFESINAKFLTSVLDKKGIYVSSGSACSCDSSKASHVLLAMGKTHNDAISSVRFTFGEDNKYTDVDYVIDILRKEITTIRDHIFLA